MGIIDPAVVSPPTLFFEMAMGDILVIWNETPEKSFVGRLLW